MASIYRIGVALCLACASAAAQKPDFLRLPGGLFWTSRNLDVAAPLSYCYDNAEQNCRRYGRLYTWEQARSVCESLGDGWRLPTDAEWRDLARQYGGVSEDSPEKGKSAYRALQAGGSSGLDAMLGGGRDGEGRYARLEAHGFYWTASDSDAGTAYYYNFGKGGMALHRQSAGEKERAFSVRCVTAAAKAPAPRR